MPKFNFWNWYAKYYDHLASPKFDADIELIKKLGDFSKADQVFDLGGGTGRVAEKIKDLVDEVIVADTSIAMLKKAAEKGIKTFSFNALPLSFGEATFDKVLVIRSLHHFIFPLEHLKEAYRILKTGGLLVIEDHDCNKWRSKIAIFFERLVDRNVRGYTRDQLTAILRNFGFKTMEVLSWRTSFILEAVK